MGTPRLIVMTAFPGGNLIDIAGPLQAFETASETRAGIGSWITYYNGERPHSTFDGQTPDEVYAPRPIVQKLAA